MPLNPDLRQRLQDLKTEHANGIIPQNIYEDLCRQYIQAYGDRAFMSQSFGLDLLASHLVDASFLSQLFQQASSQPELMIEQPRQSKRKHPELEPDNFIFSCPDCSNLFANAHGLLVHLTVAHNKGLNDYTIEQLTRNQLNTQLPTSESSRITHLSPLEALTSSKSGSDSAMDQLASLAAARTLHGEQSQFAQYSQLQLQPDGAKQLSISSSSRSDSTMERQKSARLSQHSNGSSSNDQSVATPIDTNRQSAIHIYEDGRKRNKGMAQRNSYSKSTKVGVIQLKSQGKSTEEISSITGIPRSNIEKWCSKKGQEKILGSSSEK